MDLPAKPSGLQLLHKAARNGVLRDIITFVGPSTKSWESRDEWQHLKDLSMSTVIEPLTGLKVSVSPWTCSQHEEETKKGINTQSLLRSVDQNEKVFSGNLDKLDSVVWILSKLSFWHSLPRAKQGHGNLSSLGISEKTFMSVVEKMVVKSKEFADSHFLTAQRAGGGTE